MNIPIQYSIATIHLLYVAGMACEHGVQLFSEHDKTSQVQSPPDTAERIKLRTGTLYDVVKE